MKIDLEKRAATVRILLDKEGLTSPAPVRVGLAADISGSMHPLYQRGVVQETVDRLLGVAARFDDDGSLDFWTFSDSCHQTEAATPDTYGEFIRQHVLNKEHSHYWQGTSYAPVMRAMADFYFPPEKSQSEPESAPKAGFFSRMFGGGHATPAPAPQIVTPSTPPVLLPACAMVITDGENDDKERTRDIVRRTQHLPIYWHMVGVGAAKHFRFIEELADEFDTVGFVNLHSLEQSDEDIYRQLLASEFIGWVKAQSAKKV